MRESHILRVFLAQFVIARSETTKQSIPLSRGKMDCFASLAMTETFCSLGVISADSVSLCDGDAVAS
jgi:hypothetical protein